MPRVQLALDVSGAVRDKVWVDDPDGSPWEIYTVLGGADAPAGQLRASEPGVEATCCAPAPFARALRGEAWRR